jgi:hypothetical protein
VTLPRLPALALYALALLVAFVVALSSMTHFDFWWYLKSGEFILKGGRVPDTDPFSYTAQGRTWINHMWLTQVILYWAYERAGRIPLIVAKSLLVAATFGVMLATMARRGVPPALAAVLTTLAVIAGHGYWHVRPQVVTYLLLAIYLHLLRPGWEGRLRGLMWIPVLMVPWANLHAGFVAGLGLLGLIIAGEVVERLARDVPGGWRPVGWLVLMTGLAAAGSLLNPFGVRAILFPVEVVSSREFMTTTVEWFSPNFHDPQYRAFQAMIVLLFPALALGGPVRAADLVLAVAFTHLGLSSIRHIPLFVVGATPILGVGLAHAVRRLWGWRGAWADTALRLAESRLPSLWPVLRAPLAHAGLVAVLLLALLAGYWARVAEPRAGAWAQDLNERRYPVRTMEFMKRERVPGPLFNVYVWGGYELWALYPDYQMFFDGRTHVYGERIVRDYLDVTLLHPRWKLVLDRWQVQSILTYPSYPLTQALYESPEWRLAFVDDEAVLFVRNRPAHQALFDRIGPVKRPATPSPVRTALDAGLRAAERGDDEVAIQRFREVLALDAGNPVALFGLGLLLARRGERAEAARLWEELQRAVPGTELAIRGRAELERLRSGDTR